MFPSSLQTKLCCSRDPLETHLRERLWLGSMTLLKACDSLQVTFTDGKDVKAKVMGVDEDKDLAVLIVDPAKLGTEVRVS